MERIKVKASEKVRIPLVASLLIVFISHIPQFSSAQCNFTIGVSGAALSCYRTQEDVVWTNLVNNTATGNNLTKTTGGNSWNGGAASTFTVYDNGYVETTVTATNTARMLGLSQTDVDASYTSIQYAWYLRNDGTLDIYESGTNRGNQGAYSPGDVLQVRVMRGRIYYYKNGIVLYSSNIAPSLPLLVDVSIFTLGGTLNSVLISNISDGNFTSGASAPGAGTGPTYQWKVNGVNVGTNSSSYSNPALNVNDVLTCVLTPGVSGCSVPPVTSNQIVIKAANYTFGDFYIQATSAVSGCELGTETVSWNTSSLLNVTSSTNNLTKIQSNGNWDGNAASYNSVANNGFLQFTATETNTARMIGLSTTDVNSSYASIQYAIYLQNSGIVGVYESGAGRGNFGAYATNDVFKIAVQNNVVSYFRNGTVFYISLVAPTLPLLVDVSMNANGSTLSNVVVSNPITGSFTATASNVGATPIYNWKVNGTSVGVNSTTYTNNALSNNDVVTCEITPNLNGCSLVAVASNSITVTSLSAPTNSDFYIAATPSSSGCQDAIEQAVWQIASLSNVQATGNSLIKVTSNGTWNGGAASFNTVSNNGYLQVTASETTLARMIGLSTTHASSSYTTIQYAFYLQNNGNLGIYESGTSRGNFGTYATSDLLKITVESSVIKYYRNGVLLYVSTVAPTLPLLVDVSIRDTGGTFSGVFVNNPTSGTFTATASNVGATPTYAWKLNGSTVGTNSNTYTNNSLANNDVVTCNITPSLGGCSTTVYPSNPITIASLSSPANVDFYIQGTPSSSACETATEQVVWQLASLNNSNVQASGNNLSKFQSTGWDGNAASFNTVGNNGFMQFTASEANTYRMIGLSTTDVSSSYTTIQYAIYLVNTGAVQIYESGTGRGNFGVYAPGDLFKVTVESGVVKYYRNGTLLYISTIAPTLPMLVDVSMYSVGSTLTNVLVSNPVTGTFTATATNVGAAPTYNWKVNGTSTGVTVNTYTNNALSNNDVVTCTVTPNLGGCSSAAYVSNSITVSTLPAAANVDFYIQATSSVSACQTATEQVVWQIGSLNNVQATGNSLLKIQSNGAWDGGAASFNTVSNGGYMQVAATETTLARMIGLSTTHGSPSYTTIQYAFYLQNNGGLSVFESGTNRGNVGTYITGDILKLTVESNVVKYYKNGTLVYISTVAPTLPLIVDVSLRDTGATLTNVVVSNPITGTFTATATNVGATPTYQWKLNGGNVGTNSTTYTNNSLVASDVVTCTLVPNLGGCSSTTYTSNAITVTNLTTAANVDFYIQSTPSASACQTAMEQVVWKIASLNNVQAVGNNLNKIQNNAWDGGAASFNTVSNNGFMQFTASETNTHRMIGLSTTDVNSNYTTIQYAFFLVNTGALQIYESGTGRGAFGTYATNDILKIAVESNVVKYYQNGTLLYISTIAPTLPLLVDVSINSVGGTLTNVLVSNIVTGTFTATATNVGATPTYQWQLNGVNVGTNSTTYTNNALSAADVLTCQIVPNLGGCSTTTYTSNSITIASLPAAANVDFYIQATSSVSACQTATEQVVWQIASLNNVQATGNSLLKIQSNGAWDGGAASFNTVSNGGYMQVAATETTLARMVGLSTTHASSSYTTIQYAFYLQNNGNLAVYESGTNRGNVGTYITGDILKLTVESSVVKYYKNGTLLYISTIAPTLPLIVDVSLRDTGATLTNVVVSNPITGTFTATATNVGATPTYQWKLNGGNVGTNSTTYTNNSLVASDVVTCTLVPNLGGCSTTTYTSNSITVTNLTTAANVDFYIQSTPSASACQTAMEQVVWKIASLNNVQAVGNNLNKIQNNAWDGGAASFNTVSNNGFMQFTASETNTHRMIGLSTTDVNSNYTTIQYAFYLVNTGALQIYESGTARGTFGTYATNDILKITVESSVVKYYKNGTLLYISTIAPTLPLLVDVSIYSVGGTLTNVLVSNIVTGTFTATATNVGATPTYQWQLNGVNVGTNSTTYTNNALSAADVLTCQIIPNLGGCSTTTYTSNSITMASLPAAANVDFYIQATSSVSACQTATEQVVWQIASLNNVQATGNSLLKIQSNGNWDGGAASFNTVSNNGYMQIAATEITLARMIGLSTTHASSSYTTIQYAFYLQNNGNLAVFESGVNRANVGTYITGDILKIAVESSVVKYYKNGTLLYISTIAPTLPLIVDVSLRDTGATLTNVVVSNPITGTFTATATNVGATPTYQWKLNGGNVGTNSTTYTDNSLVASDVVTCTLVPNLGGCSTTTYTSNSITVTNLTTAANVDFYIQSTPSASACQTAMEQVVWQIASLGTNMVATSNSLTKFQNNGVWDGGAASFNTVSNNGFMQFTASETNTQRMIGLSTTNVNSSYTTIQYAFFLVNTGALQIYESGTGRGAFGTYATNDILKIAVESNVVKYYKNGTLLYISTIAPTLPLLVDVSINNVGGTLSNVLVSNIVTGTFTATATNVGATPTYQWKLNGVNVGTNSTTYTNNALAAADVVTATLVPNLGGCSATTYTSNSITMASLPAAANVDFYIQGTSSASACQTATEQVVWQIASLTNVQATGNNLTKIQNNAWDGGAASFNTVSNGGYMQFTASEINTHREIGLSTTNANSSNTTIQYGIYLVNNATVQIVESGTSRGAFGTYATSDIFKITVESNVVKYYKNGTLLYISTIAPTLPLIVDVSINSVGGTLSNVLVSNPFTGTFTATATNVGATPTYQWKLNGGNVGTNSTTYTNNALAASDVVTCTLVPNLGGCSATTYTSNTITISSLLPAANVDFYILASSAASACQTATEQVVWQIASLNNVQATGSSLLKIQSNGNWDGGAASFNKVANNGYLQVAATETTTARMIGLSTTHASSSYTTIQYAFYLQPAGALGIYESGTNRGNFSTYITGDVLKITVESGVVKYYKNGTLLYISTIAPTLPLLVDVSIRDTGGTLNNVVVSNPITGTFTATATNVGATPTFQWKLNGGNVGTNSTTYTNNSLVASDVVTATLVPNLGGCSATTYTSNSITITNLTTAANVDFYIQGTSSASACQTATEQVVWQIASLTNVQATGNNLTKIQNNAWDGGAASFNTVSNGGYMQFTASEINTHREIGLSTTNANSSNTTIQYGIYLVNNATVQIVESGTSRGAFGTYATSDIFKITVESNVVKYYKNGTLLYISTIAPTLPLIVDVSINSVGGTLSNVLVSNPFTGTFTATATNVGATPTYQWKLNGGNVGTNSTTYTNNALANNDVVTCSITPNLGGCSLTTYTSNSVTINSLSTPANIDFYVQGTYSSTACQDAIEQVVWQIGSLANVQATGNNLTKIQSNGNWDGGAASFNTVNNNGYLSLVASETTTARMIGLSTTNANSNYTSIQYALYLQNTGALGVYESGTNRGNFGTYATNDILKVEVDNNVVKYYRNNVLLYISAVVPVLPLLVDVSINAVNGTLTNVKVTNQTTGTFTATSTNAGATPTYQWKLNGVNVGSNSTSYTNGSLANNDVITCVLTPNLGNCSSSNYTSNSVTMYLPGATTSWTGVTSNSWDVSTNWSNGVPDRYTAVTIPSGTPNSATIPTGGNVYDITINNGATLVMSGSPSFSVYRNWSNAGTLTPATSTVNLFGCATTNSVTSTALETFYRLVMNNSNGATVTTSTQQISNSLTLTNGIITNSALVQFADNATVSGATDISYVAGQVRKVGNDAFTFPIGKAGFYRPITMTAPGSVTDHFTAEYFHASQAFGTAKAATIDHVSGCEYWVLNRTNGASNVTVTLSWNEAACHVGDITQMANLRVSEWNGALWSNLGNGGTGGNNVNGTIITAAAVSTFGPFTLASTTASNPLPVELVSFTATPMDNKVQLNWITASELNNDHFSVQRSTDGVEFLTLTTVKGAGTKREASHYEFVDENPSANKLYYRLEQTDYSLASTYSDVVIVNMDEVTQLLVYPNPVKIDGTITTNYQGNYILYNSLGIEVAKVENTRRINLAALPAGLYILKTDKGLSQRLIIY